MPFAPLAALLFGVAFAWAARDAIGKPKVAAEADPLRFAWPFVLAFAAFVFAPVAGYFAACHGDWAYVYVLDWRTVPSAIDLSLVLVAAACVPAGYFGAALAMRARKPRVLAALALAPALLLALMTVLGGRRLLVSASYAQFHGGFGTRSIAEAALGRGVLWSLVVLALGAAWVFRALRR
jgi:hypothetical protein